MYHHNFFPLPHRENPSEEDAAIVDKILSSRTIKKEVGSDTSLHSILYIPWPDCKTHNY